MAPTDRQSLRQLITRTLQETPITDIHTHLFTPCFGDQLLWGIDELLTYHYLVAETFRWIDMKPEDFWAMSKTDRADLIWQTLFIDHSPISEACRGVLTTLARLGLDVESRDLDAYRAFMAKMTTEDYIDLVLKTANIQHLIMTNDPFNEDERRVWETGYEADPRFRTALRIDPLLLDWDNAHLQLKSWGYDVDHALSEKTLAEVRRFLSEWGDRMQAVYMAASLPPDFHFPADTTSSRLSVCSRLIEQCIVPVSRDSGRPFAMMIGVKKLVNPDLQLAGDSVGKGDIVAVETLCRRFPHNKFLVTMLARENQHELCVAARKFRNLMVFGCWWFLNNPSLIDEMTRMRLELLGPSVIPQHSDARVLDQLIYKWDHSRRIIGEALADKYEDLAATGWQATEEEIRRDIAGLMGGNFWAFLERKF